MSMRNQAGIVLPGYNALKVANAPTIGTATQASATSVSVAFTAPACVGGGAISSYTAFANCGLYTASGASSPLTVTGLTTDTAYTFKVVATNAYGPSYPSAASNSVTPVAQGQDAYTTAGTYSWVAPAGVTSVSVVAVGGGGGGGGGNNVCCGGRGAGGGALRYVNNISVTPGSSYAVVVGAGGTGRSVGNQSPTNGEASTFNTSTVVANGASGQTGGSGGTGTGGNGGNGGNCGFYCGGGGGGAAGYSGNGGAASRYPSQASAGSGGGGGGGTSIGGGFGSGGGGVGILGQGCSGAGGTSGQGGFPEDPTGKGGSGGANGAGRTGGAYGAGAGAGGWPQSGGNGGVGAVRIIYPGTTRSFPSTNTGDL